MPLPAAVMKETVRQLSGAEGLAALIKRLDLNPLPEKAEEMARLCLLDTLGVGLYGSTQPEAELFIRAAEQLGTGRVPVWGTAKKLGAAGAALVCGSLCHLRELDDVHYAILHTGCVCVPAALAAAQMEHASLGQLLRALSNGVEVTARISLGMDYMDHRERGWHGTATCGAFGAAAAVGYLLGLSEEQLCHAIAISGSRTGGTWAFSADGTMTKRLHPGLAARDGLLAAYLAREGVTGPHYVLEAEDGGFYRLFSREWDVNRLLAPSQQLEVEHVEFKWFASCKSVHSPITAAIQIRREHPERTAGQVSRILVEVNRSALSMAGHPYEEDSVVSAQISIPYGVALGLMGHSGQAEDYSLDALRTPVLHMLAERTEVVESEEFNALREASHLSGARVTVFWEDGTSSSAVATHPKGSLANPLTREDVFQNFLSLSSRVIGEEKSRALMKLVMEGEKDRPVEELLCLLTAGEE